MFKRILRFSLTLLMILVMVISAVPVTFATNTDHPNTYKNTGNMRNDLIGVALTQVGYYEGENNDTKYGEWYGYNNLAWCGMFVTWCAEQAGIPTSIIPKIGTTNPSDYKVTCYSGKDYRPLPGDLFFRKSGSGYAHVGIVYYTEGDNFYTIEGNTYWQGPEGVYIRCRTIADYDFGVPNYPDTEKHSYQAGYESAHPHKEYYKCSHCGDKYHTGKTKSLSDCRDCIAASCSHSYSSWENSDTKQHARSCSKCGKKENANHSWNSGTITKQPTCSRDGEKIQNCTICNATRTLTVSASAEHTFDSWKILNEQQHTRRCLKCAKVETKAHDVEEVWSSDTASHWYTCSGCNGRSGLEAHNFDTECDTPCQICGYIRDEAHSYSEDLRFDDTDHWNICSVCQIETPLEAHIYDDICDTTCNTCSYVRQTEHTYSEQYLSDGNGHRKICIACDFTTEILQHKPGPAATEAQPQICTACHAELSPFLAHTHKYQVQTSNMFYHSCTCVCGEETGDVSHSWDEQTGKCSTCDAERSTIIIIVALVALIAVFAIVFSILIVIRLFRRRRHK